MSLFIKNVELKSNVILAPMAGYTDAAFRALCSKYGAGLVCTEMVSSKALHYKNKKTEDLLLNIRTKCPVAVQLFGHEPEIMAEAVANPLLSKFDIIDINMGCPARKIVTNGDGSALLKTPELAEDIISACVKATDKPITVKFRIGYGENENIAVEFAKMCERAGASAITVHGRTASQGYSGRVSYETIKEVKEAVSIPVFANGDIKTYEDVQEVLSSTNADGVMIGRASLGKPEIFKIFTENKPARVNKYKQIESHYNTLLKYFPEKFVAVYMRSHLAFYLSGKYKNSKMLVSLLKEEKVGKILENLRNLLNN